MPKKTLPAPVVELPAMEAYYYATEDEDYGKLYITLFKTKGVEVDCAAKAIRYQGREIQLYANSCREVARTKGEGPPAITIVLE